jgi:hypothetical protein
MSPQAEALMLLPQFWLAPQYSLAVRRRRPSLR